MTITTSCPTCKSIFRLPAELAGRQVRCQKCENTFLVPEVAPGVLETTTGMSAAPAEVSAPPNPPVAEPVEEVIPTEIVSPAPPIEIVVVEDEPAPLAVAKPVDASKSAVLVPSPAPNMWLGRILLASFISSALLVLSGSGWWLSRNLDIRSTRLPGQTASLSPRAIPLELGSDGRLTVIGQTRQPDFVRDDARFRLDGPFELYAIHLEQGKTYNFSVISATIAPRLRVYDGRLPHADRSGLVPENKLIMAYQPKHNGEHLLLVSTSQRIIGDFILSAAQQRAAEVPRFDLAEQPSVVIKESLRLDHPLYGVDPNQSSPSREFRVTLERDRNYSISVASDDFNPKLVIFDRNNQSMEFARPWAQPNNNAHTFPYIPNITGEFRIRVTGDKFGLGDFTLRVTDATNFRPVHSVLVAFQDGLFEDRRSFLPTDPNEPSKAGLGPYKEYVVTLKTDQRYRVELKSDFFGTRLTVIDDKAQLVAGDTKLRNQPLEFTPAFSGQYHIRAIGENRKARGEYHLRIDQLP